MIVFEVFEGLLVLHLNLSRRGTAWFGVIGEGRAKNVKVRHAKILPFLARLAQATQVLVHEQDRKTS